MMKETAHEKLLKDGFVYWIGCDFATYRKKEENKVVRLLLNYKTIEADFPLDKEMVKNLLELLEVRE